MESKATELQKRISLIQSEMGFIEKKKEQNGPNYAFRSIDDAMNKLSPLLAKHEVTITSKVIRYTLDSRTYSKWDNYQKKEVEKFAFFASVHMALSFHHGEEVETWEEVAMSEDNSDKAVTQAMSMAYKYAILRKLCVLTEDISKTDADKKPSNTPAAAATPAPLPELLRTHDKWKSVTEALMKGTATLDQVKSKFVVSALVEKELLTIIEKAKEATK